MGFCIVNFELNLPIRFQKGKEKSDLPVTLGANVLMSYPLDKSSARPFSIS